MDSRFWVAAGAAAMLASCGSVELRSEEALIAESVELQVDASGKILEVEYHVTPEMVPQPVRDAMDKLHPGGRASGAEKEYVGSTLYWELTKTIDGRAVEAMFLPDGTLHQEEVEIPASEVPQAAQTTARNKLGGNVEKWEVVRDMQRTPFEYHAKGTRNGKKYKLMIGSGGELLGSVREVPAEIEVPDR